MRVFNNFGSSNDANQIECKGSDANLYRALGQGLRYNYENKTLKTYILVNPEDQKKLSALIRIHPHEGTKYTWLVQLVPVAFHGSFKLLMYAKEL